MVGTEDEHTGDSHDGSSLNGSKRASDKLGKSGAHAPAEGRISSRKIKPVRKLTDIGTPSDKPKLGSSGLDAATIEMMASGAHPRLPEDYTEPPQKSTIINIPAQPNDGKDTISVIRRIPASAKAPSASSRPATPAYIAPHTEDEELRREPTDPFHSVPVTAATSQPTLDHDVRRMIDEDANKARDSRKNIQPVDRKVMTALTEGDTDHLRAVGRKRADADKQQAHPGEPSNTPPTDSQLEKDASGSRRIYLSAKGDIIKCNYIPPKPTLTLTKKVEYALQGKRSLEKDILPLRHGLISVHLSIDLLTARHCGIIIKHADSKTPDLITLHYHAPRTSKRPGETGIDNAFEPTQIVEHTTHKDHIVNYAIPDGDANWAYVRKWVQRSADADLLGSAAVSLVKVIEQVATLITHRTTLAHYLNAVCELSRSEIDARQATKLVLEQGLAWNLKQQAPEGFTNAQAMLINEYDRLIRRWTSAYSCGHYLAQQYGLALASPETKTAATGDTMTLTKDAAGQTTAVMTKPKKK